MLQTSMTAAKSPPAAGVGKRGEINEEGMTVREFFELAIVIAFVVTVTGLLIAGVIRVAVNGWAGHEAKNHQGRTTSPAECRP